MNVEHALNKRKQNTYSISKTFHQLTRYPLISSFSSQRVNIADCLVSAHHVYLTLWSAERPDEALDSFETDKRVYPFRNDRDSRDDNYKPYIFCWLWWISQIKCNNHLWWQMSLLSSPGHFFVSKEVSEKSPDTGVSSSGRSLGNFHLNESLTE